MNRNKNKNCLNVSYCMKRKAILKDIDNERFERKINWPERLRTIKARANCINLLVF